MECMLLLFPGECSADARGHFINNINHYAFRMKCSIENSESGVNIQSPYATIFEVGWLDTWAWGHLLSV